MTIPEQIQKYYNSQNRNILEFVRTYILNNIKNHQWEFFINKLEENRKLQCTDTSDLGIWSQLGSCHIGLKIRGKDRNIIEIEMIYDSEYKTNYNIKNFSLKMLQEAIRGYYIDSSK